MINKQVRQIIYAFLIFLLCGIQNITGQTSKIDSLIYGKNLCFNDGDIPLYYSSQCEKRALEKQSFLEKSIETYFKNDSITFNLKLAVIDSAKWSGFWVPYGFFFIQQNWIVVPGDLDYQKCANLYGFYPFSDVLIRNFTKLSKEPKDLIVNTIYNWGLLHEIGHYYTRNIVKAAPPDRWTNESMAQYFTIDFLYQNDKLSYDALGTFASTYVKEVEPSYKNLTDFNTKYANVGLQNYCWYILLFHLMGEDIYSKYGKSFIDKFAEAFPITEKPIKYSQEEIIIKLDKLTGNIASKWISKMDGSKKEQ